MSSMLWWGRFDPEYSRNRVLRSLLQEHGWTIRDFHPLSSGLGDIEAGLRGIERPELVWVPCFRQRDMAAAARWALRRSLPLVFDPLISAYDKQVDERGRLAANSTAARKLLARERSLFARATRVVADTQAHADYFSEVLGVSRERLGVVYVGAEESLFRPMPAPDNDGIPEVLFYGSFIPLQGPQVIVEAARIYQGPSVKWTLLGNGPLHEACRAAATGIDTVQFEDPVPYEQLPARIARASVLLGIFGTTPKAGRVIPNKVFQSLACGRMVITQSSSAYPQALQQGGESGIEWIEAGNAQALAMQVKGMMEHPERLALLGEKAARTAATHFSSGVIWRQLSGMLENLSQ